MIVKGQTYRPAPISNWVGTLVKSKVGDFFEIFVAFSEYVNFKKMKYVHNEKVDLKASLI